MKQFYIFLAILFSYNVSSQNTIDVYVYSDYNGPVIDFTFEESGVENKFDGFRLTGWMSKDEFKPYSDNRYGRYILNCDKLEAAYNRKRFEVPSGHHSEGLFKKLHRIKISNPSPFTLMYFAQENGRSKGTWTGILRSKPASRSPKCMLLNLNQTTSSVNQFGRLYFYKFGAACDGYNEIYINGEYIGKYRCFIDPQNPLIQIKKYKGYCDDGPKVYGDTHFLVSKQLEYGKYTIKRVFKDTDGNIISTSTRDITLDEPCENGNF